MSNSYQPTPPPDGDQPAQQFSAPEPPSAQSAPAAPQQPPAPASAPQGPPPGQPPVNPYQPPQGFPGAPGGVPQGGQYPGFQPGGPQAQQPGQPGQPWGPPPPGYQQNSQVYGGGYTPKAPKTVKDQIKQLTLFLYITAGLIGASVLFGFIASATLSSFNYGLYGFLNGLASLLQLGGWVMLFLTLLRGVKILSTLADKVDE